MKLRVCIPTAGTGSRLGDLGKNINKSLIQVANKPTISHQIEMFPDSTEFVIALGYKGHLVKEYLKLTYPKKKFYFSHVKDFTSKNSGLGLSLLSCKKYLNQPFIFLSCDTIIKGELPKLNKNWMGYSSKNDLAEYRSIDIKKNLVKKINEKGNHNKNSKAYIGFCGVFDYSKFWHEIKNGGLNAIYNGEVFGLKCLIEKNIIAKRFKWYDTGNLPNLKKTRSSFKKKDTPIILEKENESIWFTNNLVIKFSTDKKFIRNRVLRSEYLTGYIPKLNSFSKYMYTYKMKEGKILSKIVDEDLFRKLLLHSSQFWKKSNLSIREERAFIEICKKFYYDKTFERIKEFHKKFRVKDSEHIINNKKIPKLSLILKKINWLNLFEGTPVRFHGDFHFENIIYEKKNSKFIFLDWRQDFGGLLKYGDIYYDLAKLLHGIIINHEIILKDQYSIKWNSTNILFKIKQRKNFKNFELLYENWCIENQFNYQKIKILTALIFLNISPLHHYPYSLLLYALGKSMLYEVTK